MIGRLVAPHLVRCLNTSYAVLSSGIPWNMPRVTCIFRVHTSLQASVYTKKIQVRSGEPLTSTGCYAVPNRFYFVILGDLCLST